MLSTPPSAYSKAEIRVRAVVEPRLEPGEELRLCAIGDNVVGCLGIFVAVILALVTFAIGALLAQLLVGDAPILIRWLVWVLCSMGVGTATIAPFMRNYLIAVTGRRLLLIDTKPGMFSTFTNVRKVAAYDLARLPQAQISKFALTKTIRIQDPAFSFTARFPTKGPLAPQLEEIIKLLQGAPPTPTE